MQVHMSSILLTWY